ncbi:MAG: hypothetical protein SVV03_05015, partial [Candidatus Nanohaloarchaea archaeon]|nr:hypothetical protein [Candidatus Nanohaloarchaea archaeon]
MKYLIESENEEIVEEYSEKLDRRGLEVVDRYSQDEDLVLVSLGGDGSILYNAWNNDEPTILPIVSGKSDGNKIQLGEEDLFEAVELVENDQYYLERHRQLTAYNEGGEELKGDFRTLGEIIFNKRTFIRAAIFNIEIEDENIDLSYESEKLVGDGAVFATPFGSGGYFYAITEDTFESGIGIAFNNVRDSSVEDYIRATEEATVRITVPDSLNPDHSSRAVMSRDNDPDFYYPEIGETVEIEFSDSFVEIV